MKKLIFVLSALISISASAAPGKFYFCQQAGSFPLADMYLLSINAYDVYKYDYSSEFFAWELDGSPVDQGAWESKLTWTPFGSTSYRFRIYMIPGELNYGCEAVNTVPSNIRKLANEISPRSQY